jgi:DNA-binding response OmpR family regulator
VVRPILGHRIGHHHSSFSLGRAFYLAARLSWSCSGSTRLAASLKIITIGRPTDCQAEGLVRSMDRRLLIVDDDPLLTDSLEFLLQQEGYDVAVAGTGTDALDIVRTSPPDLVLLDVGLPDLNGVEVCRRLRGFWNGPVIVLTARRQEADKVIGLDAGADDYITKPFSSSELLARIRAGLRRAQQSVGGPAIAGELVVGDLRINRDARTVTMAGQPIHLSARELDLLLLLAERAGMALPRRYLFDTIWGPRFYGDERALDVYIRSLRKKIEPDPDRPAYIHTVRGVGYRLEQPPDA